MRPLNLSRPGRGGQYRSALLGREDDDRVIWHEGPAVDLLIGWHPPASRWDGNAAACGVRDDRDITGIFSLPC